MKVIKADLIVEKGTLHFKDFPSFDSLRGGGRGGGGGGGEGGGVGRL